MSALAAPALAKRAVAPFLLVSKDHHSVIDQLISSEKKDKVHPIPESRESFIGQRIDCDRGVRQTWVKLNEEGEVIAALYSAQFSKKIVSEMDFQGDMRNILLDDEDRCENADLCLGDPRSMIFYSISSFAKGAGRDLIREVYKDHHSRVPEMKMATLSPARALTQASAPRPDLHFLDWVKFELNNAYGDKGKVDNELKVLQDDPKRLRFWAVGYFLMNINKVQGFHMRNGGYLGDVNTDANAKGTDDYAKALGVMPNFVYDGDPEELDGYAARYQSDKPVIGIAEHLYQDAVSFAGICKRDQADQLINRLRVRTLS